LLGVEELEPALQLWHHDGSSCSSAVA
jgi:hypothetical protein